ncbi:hypothetical protein THRCLA_03525 [Thraustotheca clavata]|uniref:N-alpha-acetyltransferase 60 n=1 Tax=Thraustotheca clavata TaxID=74557 RepID=A0A1W0A223_9STRA|nr:hypothetical protein THRCLA_03525 [Thraustotheca clavata]
MGDITLRRLEPRDIPQLQALHEDWFPIRYNDAFYQNAGEGIWETGEPLFTQVAVEFQTDVLIGAVTAQIQSSDQADEKQLVKDGSLMYILTLGARHDYRRRGIASALLETCIQEANASPHCGALYLHVKADNFSAIRFYEKNGFQRLRFLQDYYLIHGQNHHAYLYIRYINGGSAPVKWIDLFTRPLSAIVSFFSRFFHGHDIDDKACSITTNFIIMFVLDDQEIEEAENERLKKKLQAKNKLTPEEEAIQQQQALINEKNKYWAPILLLYPLGPVCVALTTVVFGGVITNAASTTCNAHLGTFLQGAVGLSYILILFYAYCWIGPWPIRKLKMLKFFYSFYGVICIGWWGVFGTAEAMAATASGFNSCLSTSPMLYVFSQYQITIFWLLFVFFLCFAFKEMYIYYKATDQVRKADSAKKQAKKEAIEKEETLKKAAKEEAERIEQEKQAAIQREKEERDKLYAKIDNDDEDDKVHDENGHDENEDDDNGEDDEEDGSEEDEENDQENDENNENDDNAQPEQNQEK